MASDKRISNVMENIVAHYEDGNPKESVDILKYEIKKAREEVIKELQTLCHIKEGDVWKKLTISKLAWERLIEKLNSSQARNTPQSESGSKKEVEE